MSQDIVLKALSIGPSSRNVTIKGYALAKIGAIVNMIDPRLGKDELIRIVREPHSDLVVCLDLGAKHVSESLI